MERFHSPFYASTKHQTTNAKLTLVSIDSDINALIFDYLTTEGYPSAAAKFSKEANLRPQQEEESLIARRQIIQSIHSGKIQEAIESLNELEPQVLDSNPSLHFALLRLQLVELIRTCNATPGGDITPALNFATTQLAPRAPTNKEFMEDLERTMALLVFPSDSLEPPLAALLQPTLRRQVADRVNKAILSSQNIRRDAAIRGLVRLRAWAEDTARQSKKDLPSHLDLGLDESNEGHENGHEPMIT
ncbi:related to LisH motif-containing protein [Phialocephala subalpina]|uniref:Related to LisH motif-containing protein n=1 Tax=Phialocephala subalpina TaxID=576137 RepID=A0A1L7XEP9_9HELO|nr:related to LisH motif-containing protein [Phialocephala subalpina]